MQQQQNMQERIRAFFVCLGYIVMVTSLALGSATIVLEKLELVNHFLSVWYWLVYQSIFIANGWYIDMTTLTLYNQYIDTPLWMMSFFLGVFLVLAGWALGE